jgi:hypothetical protein
MVAHPESLEHTAEATVLAMCTRMEELAVAGDWDDVEDIAERLRTAVMQVPEADRRAVLLAVKRSTDKVEAGAKKARDNVTDKLSELRRGQAAKKAYELR